VLYPYVNLEAVFAHGQTEHLITAHNYIGVVSLATIAGTLAGYEHSGLSDSGPFVTSPDCALPSSCSRRGRFYFSVDVVGRFGSLCCVDAHTAAAHTYLAASIAHRATVQAGVSSSAPFGLGFGM